MIKTTKHFFWNLISSGLPMDYELEVLRKIVLMNLINIVGIVFLGLYAVISIIQMDFFLGAVDLVVLTFLAVLFVYLRKKRNHQAVGVIGTIVVGLFFFFLVAYGGVNNTAFVWMFTYPLVAFFLLGTKLGALMSLSLWALTCLVFVNGDDVSFFTVYRSDLSIRLAAVYIIIFLFSYTIEKVRSIIRGRLEAMNLEIEKTVETVREQSFALVQTNKGLQQEIAERKRMEKALRSSENFLDDVIESIQDGINVLDPDLTIRHTNNIMKRWYRDQLPLEGKKCFVCYQNREQPCDPCPSLRCLETGKAERNIVSGVPGGAVEWVELYSFPIKDKETNEITGVVEFVRDITERRKVEQAMKDSEERYRSLVENTMEGYFICEIPSGKFLFLNKRSCDIYGYTLKEALTLAIWDVISPDEHERVIERIQERMEGDRMSSARHAYTSVLKDGSTIRVEISTSLIKYRGKPVVQGIVRDITEQERLQQQLQQSKKMEAIGLLAGGVAHDLNNVLSGIVSYPDLILMDLPKDSPLVEPVQTIQASGQKAAEIVQDLLTLARRGVSTKSVLNLNDVILNYVHSPEHKRLVSYHPDVSIETDLDENLLNIEGSSTQLIKSVMNLVSNAAEAQPSGGQVLITTKNQTIETPIKGYEEINEGDFVVLGVEDNGLGIATEDLDRIFEPFYTKKVMGRSGTGLGMAVVWGTVHDHEGYINVKSTEGVGTRFTLYFPVIRAEITGRELVPVEEYLGNRETILVVDDVIEQRDIAAMILSKLNYSVATASRGEEAVAHVKEHAVDLLILDMIMDPGIDGLETYKRIKELHPHQKAIIASGYSETHRVKEAITLGAGKYIRKPYTLEKIGIAVRDELRQA